MNVPAKLTSGYPADDRVVSLNEAAVITGLSLDTIKRRNAAGELKIVRLTKRRRGIRLSDLMAFISERAA